MSKPTQTPPYLLSHSLPPAPTFTTTTSVVATVISSWVHRNTSNPASCILHEWLQSAHFVWVTFLCEYTSDHIFPLLSITLRKINTQVLHLAWPGPYSAGCIPFASLDPLYPSPSRSVPRELTFIGCIKGLPHHLTYSSLTKERWEMGRWPEIAVQYLFLWISRCCVASEWLHRATVRSLL